MLNRFFSTSLTLLGVFLLNSCSPVKSVEWHMINVNYRNQGDAHLLTDGSVNVMIDAGEKYAADQALIPYLKSKGVRVVHHFFLSHPHTDHYGGIESLLDAGISIVNIYTNLPPDGIEDWNYKRTEFMALVDKAIKLGANHHDVKQGFDVQLPTSKISVVYAQKEPLLKSGKRVSINDYSLILKWDTGIRTTLFTGDLNEPLGAELAGNAIFKADILKVPHHGVTGVAPNSFFDTVNPKLNMFPSTAALWNHPRIVRVKNWTGAARIHYCNNGLNGNVVVQYSGTRVLVNSETETVECPNGALGLFE